MKLNHLAAMIGAVSILSACGGGSSGSSSAEATSLDLTDSATIANVAKVVETNADIAYAIYSDSVSTAEALKTAIANFKAAPTEDTLLAAKKAWLVAREAYGQSEVYRFRLSPIDSTDYATEDGPEGDINAWPLGEALIDYVQTNDSDFTNAEVGVTANGVGLADGGAVNGGDANIINSDITIDADLLANTATADDEHDVIAGYHAIEFLLWGQDLNDGAEPTTGTTESRADAVKTEAVRENTTTAVYPFASGGERPLTDFTTDTYADRRLTYLEVATDKLISDLTDVRDAWASGAEYRTAFTTVTTEAEARQKLTEILTGMGTLSEGELAGERMQISFADNSQEDEHSCFSDNTHRDIWLNAEGVKNSYYGEYAGYDSDLDGTDDAGTAVTTGYGFDDLLADAGMTTLAGQMEAALTATEEGYMAIDARARLGEPVDVLITSLTTDNPMYTTIYALNAQSAVIADLAEAAGIDGSDVVDADASDCDTQDPTASCAAE